MVITNKQHLIKPSKDFKLKQKINQRLHRDWLLVKLRKDVKIAEYNNKKEVKNDIV